MIPLIILVLPLALGLLFNDSTWLETERHTDFLLVSRLNLTKVMYCRYGLAFIFGFLLAFVGFMLNFLVLGIAYGFGNRVLAYGNFPFYEVGAPNQFLNALYLEHPNLGVLASSFYSSLVLAIITSSSYALSFIVNKRLKMMVYVLPLILVIGTEIISIMIPFRWFSLANLLQTAWVHRHMDYVLIAIFWVIVSQIILFLQKKKWKKGICGY